MDVVKWNDSYKTGNVVVDTQHEHLFRMVNELHATILEEKGHDIIGPILEQLAGYVMEHYRSEEALMTQVRYPGFAEHKRKHEELTKEVKDLVKKYRSRQVTLTLTLSKFLANWLQHHIKEEDMALIRYCQSQPRCKASAAKA